MAAAENSFSPVEMLRATVAALGALDGDALESLRAKALSHEAAAMPLDAQAAVDLRSLHSTLARLLDSTNRNLATLRALHDAAVQSATEAAWAR